MSLLVDFTIIYQIISIHALKQLILFYLVYIITVKYRYKIPDYTKRFNNLIGSPLARLHYKDKYFSYL